LPFNSSWSDFASASEQSFAQEIDMVNANNYSSKDELRTGKEDQFAEIWIEG
jgi:hypothetical protein